MARPIIMGMEGERLEIVERAGCGLAIEPENDAEPAKVVMRPAEVP